jgi:hypothetical protein
MVVSDEATLEELNQVLGEGGWWVDKIAPGNDGSWLVILTDRDPDKIFSEDDHVFEEEEIGD